MNVWEEVGWRGYALPSLQEEYGALVSSLLVGVLWALWHWPFFVVKDSAMYENYHGFFWFVLATLFGSVTYAWLYNSTRGSLLTVSLFHASTNAVNITLFSETGIARSVFPFHLIIVAAFSLLLIIVMGTKNLSRRDRALLQQEAAP